MSVSCHQHFICYPGNIWNLFYLSVFSPYRLLIYMKLHVVLFSFLYHLPALLVLHAASNKSSADGLSKLWKILMWLDRFIKCSQIVHSWIDISPSSAPHISQCVCIYTNSRWEPWPHIKKLINLRVITSHQLADHESVRRNSIKKWPQPYYSAGWVFSRDWFLI